MIAWVVLAAAIVLVLPYVITAYESYLPNTIASKVANCWADRFAEMPAQAQLPARVSQAQAHGQQPRGFAWHSGSKSPWPNTGSFVESLSSYLSGAYWIGIDSLPSGRGSAASVSVKVS